MSDAMCGFGHSSAYGGVSDTIVSNVGSGVWYPAVSHAAVSESGECRYSVGSTKSGTFSTTSGTNVGVIVTTLNSA